MEFELNKINIYSLNDLLNKEIICDCGRKHYTNMKKVLIEENAIEKTADVLRELGYKKALILSDQITWDIAAHKVAEVLDKKEFVYDTDILQGKVIPDESRIGNIVINTAKDIDIILSVGTGVICDLGKLVAYKMGIDTGIIVTAPSVDGFASKHAAMVIGKLKISYSAVCPTVLIGDVNILKQAPMSMIIAGWSDIMGKFSALSDWKISSIVNNEYYCNVISEMVKRSVQTCRNNLEKIKQRESSAIKEVMEGLVLTGIAMSFVGTSRPASGSEHHLSHCWEMKSLENGEKIAPHGIQIGVSEILIARLYKWLLEKKNEIDFLNIKNEMKNFNEAIWEKNIENYFEENAKNIINEIKTDKRYALEKRMNRLKTIETNWNEICKILEHMPSDKDMCTLMKDAGTAVYPKDINISEKEVADSVRMAKEVRSKYTILGLLDDLGLLEEFAKKMEFVCNQ